MKKTIILYKSKYGATKQYAQWLQEYLTCDVLENKHITIEQVKPYDTIILGGGIYAGGIAGRSFFEKHFEALKEKQLILFAVGASPYDEAAIKALRLPSQLKEIPLFYCRGSWDETCMSLKDKALVAMSKKMVAKKEPSSMEPWESALLEATHNGAVDWTEKAYLSPILDYINQNKTGDLA